VIPSLLLAALAPKAVALGAPVIVNDGSIAINVDTGHAAPWVHDMNNDGKPDLLVGQFDGGKLRIYTNKGTREAPKFDGFEYLKVEGKEASVPYG
jgi:hypothetical protein